ncbi:MAG: biotin--[acetyl-CoA-carboxylase] ligase [Arenibacterium sp.]
MSGADASGGSILKEKKPADWPAGYGRRVLARVDSTLDEARRIAPELAGPEWILALEQTSGRGRRGRAWRDPAGNMAATLVLPGGDAPDRAALRSFVAALALYDACVTATGQETGFALKWPNDVLLNGGKLAGILLESSGTGRRGSCLAIGIGVNLVSAPEPATVEAGAVMPVSLKSETGITVGAETLFDHLAAAYAEHEARFVTFGFAPIRDAWLSRAARLGERITARIGTCEVQGRFKTVDETGNLVLETASGQQAIPAGDVFF